MRLLLLATALLALAAAGGCGGDASSTAAPERVLVVATTTQAADLARNAAGDRAEVRGLLPPNADPHGYELRPSDVDALADADVIVRSGGDLDDWLNEAIKASGSDAEVVTLIDHVKTRKGGAHHHEEEEHAGEEERTGEEEHAGEAERTGEAEHAGEAERGSDEEVDPHWWHDPRNAVLAVDAIRNTLAAADPDAAAAYRTATARYSDAIRQLDTAVADCIGQVPEDRRKLVTTHDALGYYAARYGIEVVGAVIPSLSTQGQASAGETAELVATIRRERVRAIFAESSVDARVERAIARDTGARLGAPLYSDTLGPQGSPGATYLGSLAANTRAIVEGFTGAPASCRLPA